MALTDQSSPAYLPGLFQIALGSVLDSPRITEAARTGAGIGWHDHVADVHEGCERFFRPSYHAHLVTEWLPALDGVVAKLQRGAAVADVGCGHGSSTLLMAEAFPASTFTGSDYHDGSITTARQRGAALGVGDRVRFEVAPAASFPGRHYDLVTMFDCLHDMGDPPGAARHVRQALAADGTWMIVEPAAGDRSRTTSTPSGGPTTLSPPCCARPARCPRRSAWPWVPRPERPVSARSSPPAGSAGSAGWPRRPSTSSTRPGPDPASRQTAAAMRAGRSP